MRSDPLHNSTQGLESIRRGGLTPFALAVRLLLGGGLAWCVALAGAAPEVPRVCAVAALAVCTLSIWRPGAGLLLVAGLAPAGALLAPPPARAAELLAWAFLAGWLLRLWRPLSASRWPRTITILSALYCAAVVASWLTLTMSGAAGVPPAALPQFLLQSIPRDHLILSSPEAETWTLLQSVTGVGLFLAALGNTRDNSRLAPHRAPGSPPRTPARWGGDVRDGDPAGVRPLAWALVASAAILAVATVADVVRQWTEVGYGAWFLLRYVNGERFSLHLRDLNAAGSLYVLAGLVAVTLAIVDRDRRGRWIGVLVVMVPALWLAGSRSSFVALMAGLLILSASRSRWQPTRAQIAAGASLLLVVLLAGALVADWRTDVRGSVGRAASLRSQFSQTTARMVASSPVFGVGVGRYFDRSSEFMPEELRALYGNENAHNYFAQQFAELGVVGGLLFVWLVVAVVSRGWSGVRRSGVGDGATVGLFVGTAGYLLTCLTGHPLLVSEAAFPFWTAFGAVAAGSRNDADAPRLHRVIAVVAGALLAVGVGGGAASYARTSTAPPEQGFHGLETATDGTRFRWMTRHAVTYIPDEPGIVRLRLRSPDRPLQRPLIVETAIAGRGVDRRELPQGGWVTYDVAMREPAPTPFRRVDLRVNQQWTEEVRLGRRAAQRPIAVMVAEIGWTPVGVGGR